MAAGGHAVKPAPLVLTAHRLQSINSFLVTSSPVNQYVNYFECACADGHWKVRAGEINLAFS